MNKRAMLKVATASVVLGTTTVGWTMNSAASQATTVDAARAERVAASSAQHATNALAAQHADKAVGFAEVAVANAPRNAAYRMLLGQAYLAAGRFQSAEASFKDTLTLDPGRQRAALNLSLAQTALGKGEAARSTLNDYRERLTAADFGLAMALAGDVPEAIRVLEYGARAPDADAKVRQNLALAYALAGDWTKAKAFAAQDLSPADLDQRMSDWAVFAKPVSSHDQVASLLRVRAVADPGQPTQLALAAPAAPVVQTAQVAPQPEPVAVAVVASAEPAAPAYEVPTVQSAATETAAASPAPAPAFEMGPSVPVVQPLPAKPAPTIRAPQQRMKVAARPAAPAVRPVSVGGRETGKFVVQLGAFSNARVAEAAWGKASSRFSLASFSPVGGSAQARGGKLVRVSVAGFATRTSAQGLCNRIRATGGVCFVRPAQGDAPTQWTARTRPTQVAAR